MKPEVGGVLETSLYAEDLERSVRFYQSIFGFESLTSNQRLHCLSVAGRQVLLLFKKGASAQPIQTSGGVLPPHDGSGTTHLTFAIAAADLDAWEKWLRQNGVAIESRMVWEEGGHSLYFQDPDNHLLELATPGTWPIY